MNAEPLTAVGISGSPSSRSRSRSLLEHALDRLRDNGLATELVDLAELEADALLARRSDPEVQRALGLVERAAVVVASTPVYRATYTGLLKVFFDQFPQRALDGKVAFGIASGAGDWHRSMIDQGLKPLFESVNAKVVPGIYVTDAQLASDDSRAAVLQRIDEAISAAVALSRDASRKGP